MGNLGSLANKWFQVTFSALNMVGSWLLKLLEWLCCKKEFPQKLTMVDYKIIIKFTMQSQFLIMKLLLKSLSQIMMIQPQFPCWCLYEFFSLWAVRFIIYGMYYIGYVLYWLCIILAMYYIGYVFILFKYKIGYVLCIMYYVLWIMYYVQCIMYYIAHKVCIIY